MSGPPPDPVYVLRGGGSPVTAVEFGVFRHNQQCLLSGNEKGIINIWNLQTKRIENTLNGHAGKSILCIRCLNDGKILSHGRDGNLLVWNEDKIEVTINTHGIGYCKFEVIYDNKDLTDVNVAVAGKDQSEIDIISLKTKQITRKLKPDSSQSLGMCMCLKYVSSEQQGLLFVGYENGELLAWDVKAAKIISKLLVYKQPLMCIDFDASSYRGIVGSVENQLKIFTASGGNFLQIQKTVDIKNPGISDIKVRGDGRIIATAGWDYKLRIFSWKSLKALAILNYHSQSLSSLSFSNCKEQLLAAGSKDGRISLWSLYKDN